MASTDQASTSPPTARRRRWGGYVEPINTPDLGTEADYSDLGLSSRALTASSPIARRIFMANMVAMITLVMGLLALNGQERSLVDQRIQTLTTEAQFAAKGVAAFATEIVDQPDGTKARALDQSSVRKMLIVSSNGEGARIMVFDHKLRLMGDTNELFGGALINVAPPENRPPGAEAIGAITSAWRRLFSTVALQDDGDIYERVREGMQFALEGTSSRFVGRNPLGALVLAISMPVFADGGVIGVTLLTTQAGEIEIAVRRERATLLIVCGLALAVSVALSMVLAAGIAQPLRLLAAAAERSGADSTATGFSAERMRIPDLSNRPDEIGYLSKAMRAMTRALYDRIVANESFAADVSHEIKNPLTSLRSAVETMRYVKTDEQRGKLLDVIEGDVKRLDRLVTDISNASRLDSELVRDEKTHFNMRSFFENMVAATEAVAEEADVSVVVVGERRRVELEGLENRLAQVFINLITNAISFAEPGQTIRIHLGEPNEREVEIRVEDEGPGIPDDNLADVFERFYSERPSQEFGSHSGLGLAISRQIIEAHGGRIWAENVRPSAAGLDVPPMGARFVVVLPMPRDQVE